MSIEAISFETLALAALSAVFMLTGLLFLLRAKRLSASGGDSDNITTKGNKLELVALDEEEVITEVINTLDYHQVPKSLLVEKARKLAIGKK